MNVNVLVILKIRARPKLVPMASWAWQSQVFVLGFSSIANFTQISRKMVNLVLRFFRLPFIACFVLPPPPTTPGIGGGSRMEEKEVLFCTFTASVSDL